jgi:hypothetical protein
MVEIEVVITTPHGREVYKVMAPETTSEHASGVLCSSVELGCALLDAAYRKDSDACRVDPRQVQ